LVSAAWAQDEKAVYDRAKGDYNWLISHPQARAVYHNWQSLADRFARIYTANPRGPLAAPSLYWTARVHTEAYKEFKRENDFFDAIDLYRRLISHFPQSNLADDAQIKIAELYEKSGDLQKAYLEYLKVTTDHPRGDMVKKAKARLNALEKVLAKKPSAQRTPVDAASPPAPGQDTTLAEVSELRHWTTPTYTRVILALERPVPYTTNLLKKDPAAQKPRRLYMDLRGARLPREIKDTVPIGDGLLQSARLGQFTRDTVRLVLDIKHLASYKVFTLDNPFRVVVDCFGETPKASKAAEISRREKKVPRGRATEKPPEVGLAAALGLGIRRVVIDPGHGGKDPGAVWQGLMEKDIVLDVARQAAKKLRKLLGCEVLLTRNKDTFVPLEDRTAFANTNDADVFISIHTNAAPSHRLSGVETYFLNLASDEESMRVAARENATTKRSISDLQVILNDLMLNSKINESNRLARALHKEMLTTLNKKHRIRNLKVKQAPFYVLIGARMPSALIEVGFITNPQEHQRLGSAAYREKLAEGIALGIAAYAKELKTAQSARNL